MTPLVAAYRMNRSVVKPRQLMFSHDIVSHYFATYLFLLNIIAVH